MPRSLAARLTIGVAVLVSLVVVAVGGATYYSLNVFLQERLDQQVSALADSTSARIDRNCMLTYSGTECSIDAQVQFFLPGSSQGSPNQRFQLPQAVYIAVYSGSKPLTLTRVGVRYDNVQALVISAEDSQGLMAAVHTPHTVRSTDGRMVRAMAVTYSDSGLTVITGLDTDELDHTLHQLLRVELIIGLIAIVVALLFTATGVQLGLRPLHRVTRTAQEVAAELSPAGTGLNRRVPVTETRTEVGQLAVAVNTLLSAVEQEFSARVESEHRMRQFLADASHELRTPLTSIRGYAELDRMRRAATGGKDSAAAEDSDTSSADALERIEVEGNRMSRLVEDLLILARSDRGTVLQYELVDVADLVDEAVAGARAANPGREIVAQSEPGLTLWGDHDQLLRVLRNLVTNAAVHTRAEGTIWVSAFRAAKADGVHGSIAPQEIILTVKDEGPGLEPEDAVNVFGRFWRADKARTRARGGSGLGLSIVASIVAAHSGRVWFDSSVAEGTTVTVALPVGTPPQTA